MTKIATYTDSELFAAIREAEERLGWSPVPNLAGSEYLARLNEESERRRESGESVVPCPVCSNPTAERRVFKGFGAIPECTYFVCTKCGAEHGHA